MSDTQLIRCPNCGLTNQMPREKIEQGLKPLCGGCKMPLLVPSKPLTVTDATFSAEVERSPLPVLLDMWAAWCEPRRMMAPVLDELAAEMAGRVRVAKLNVDENPVTATRFNVRSTPTLLVLKAGQEIDRIVGVDVQPKAEIARRLERAIAENSLMSLAVKFDSLNRVVRFLKWTAQPQIAYPWSHKDRFFLPKTVRGTKSQAHAPYEVWVELADPMARDPLLEHIRKMERLPSAAQVPDAYKKSAMELGLAEMIQRLPLVEAPRPRRSRHDVLLALYGVTHDAVAEIFASVPKNFEQKSSLIFLDANRPQTDPQFLIRLPLADPRFHWPVWLASINQRLGKGEQICIQLFYQLQGGSSGEYFVEYGWAHPLPELVDLYLNQRHAQYVLISADTGGRPRWVHIVHRPGDTHLQFREPHEPSVTVSLPQEPEVLDCEAITPSEPLRLALRVEAVLGTHGATLAALEKRIQGTKNTLFQLEQQRAVLLAKGRGRFRLLLQFRQLPTPDGETPRLPDTLQRFLRMCRHDFSAFDYAFWDSEAGEGVHYLLTREAVFYQDLPLGLADGVFHQPQEWYEGHIPIFLRDGCQLFPQLDHGLAEELLAEIRNRVNGVGFLLLLEPGPPPENQPRITVLSIPQHVELGQHISLLNIEYPIAERATRVAIREELKAALETLQADLHQEVERIEQSLHDQARLRLERAQVLWNDVSSQIEQAERHLQYCRDAADTVSEIGRDFAVTWREFLDRVLAWNRALVSEKLDWLQKLDHEPEQWRQTLEEVEQSNRDVASELPPLSTDIAGRLASAKQEHDKAHSEYAVVQQKAGAAQTHLQAVSDDLGKWRTAAETACKVVENRNQELEVQLRHLHETLISSLQACQERLRRHLDSFRKTIDDAKQQHLKIQDHVLPEIQEASVTLEQTRQAWQTEHQAAQKEIEQFDVDFRETSRRLTQTRGQLQRLEARTNATTLQMDATLRGVQQETEQTEARLAELRSKLAQLQQDQPQLQELKKQLATAQQRTQEAREDRRQLVHEIGATAAALKRTLSSISSDLPGEVQRMVEQLAATANTLGESEVQRMAAQLEVTANALSQLASMWQEIDTSDNFRQSVRWNLRLASEFHTLKDKKLSGMIWGTDS